MSGGNGTKILMRRGEPPGPGHRPGSDLDHRVAAVTIDALEAIQAGGTTHWIRVRGADAANPVLLLIQHQAVLSLAAMTRAAGERSQDEPLVSGEDDEDLPAVRVAAAGASAGPAKDYLKQIGKVALLNARQEVELGDDGVGGEDAGTDGRAAGGG